MNATIHLDAVQERVHALGIDAGSQDEGRCLLLYADLGDGLLTVSYYGLPWATSDYDPYADTLGTLALPDVAPRVKIVSIAGPDEGANGTRNWDIAELVTPRPRFENLTTFHLQGTEPQHHNRSILTLADNCAAGALLDCAPNLRDLCIPSAPDASFFARSPHPLEKLTVQASYDPQGFLSNLARSSCFPALHTLDYADFSEAYSDGYPDLCATFEELRGLFSSPAFVGVRVAVLRNTHLKDEEFRALRAIDPGRLIVRATMRAEYVR